MRPALNKSKREMLRRLNDQVERARGFATYLVRNMEEVNAKADIKAALDDLKSAKLILDKVSPLLMTLWSDAPEASKQEDSAAGQAPAINEDMLLKALEKLIQKRG